MERAELAELLALREVDGIGDSRALELFRAFDSGAALRSSPLAAFEGFHYVDAATHEAFQTLEPAVERHRKRLDRLAAGPVDVLGIDDDRYPAALRELHAPLVLYAKGDLDRLDDPAVGVSGSRETNEAGREWIRGVAGDVADAGYAVVSGGARGADTAAHAGALAATGATIVVLGTGVETPYPPENEALFERVVDGGGLLLSHRPPDAEPRSHAFPERNRTISALSRGLVVVATGESGGTMAQSETALDQGRQVFVPPADTGIRPDEGLADLREAAATTVVADAAELRAALRDLDGPAPDDQTNLDDWQ